MGQPMHLTPFFFSFIIYATAAPMITTITSATIKLSIRSPMYYFAFFAYSDSVFFLVLKERPVTAAMKEFFGSSQLSQFMDQTNPTAIMPGTNASPTVLSTISVPIWYTRNATT